MHFIIPVPDRARPADQPVANHTPRPSASPSRHPLLQLAPPRVLRAAPRSFAALTFGSGPPTTCLPAFSSSHLHKRRRVSCIAPHPPTYRVRALIQPLQTEQEHTPHSPSVGRARNLGAVSPTASKEIKKIIHGSRIPTEPYVVWSQRSATQGRADPPPARCTRRGCIPT